MKKQNRLFAFFGMNKYQQTGAVSALLILLTLTLLITANALMGLLPYRVTHPDVSASDTFDISGTTEDWLAELEQDVFLYLIANGGKNAVDGDLYAFLCLYAEASPRVRVEVVDPAVDPSFISSYGGEWPADKSVIVASARRYRIIEEAHLYYYYNSALEMKLTPEEYTSCLNAYMSGRETTSLSYAYGQALYAYADLTTAYFDGESRVTNAINFVTRQDVPVLYIYTGAGCAEPEGSLSSLLSDVCYDIRTSISLRTLPEDCDVLILHAPSTDLGEDEAAALASYLESGGKLFLSTFDNAGELPNLGAVLASYGMHAEEGIHVVMEGKSSYMLSDSQASYPYLFYAHVASEHALTARFANRFVAFYPHEIKLTETEGVTQTKLLYTSDQGYLSSYDAENKKWVDSEQKGERVFGAVAEKGEGTIVWLASSDSLTSQINSYTQDNGNYQLTVCALNWMSGIDSDAIAVESAAFESNALNVSVGQFTFFGILLVLILPLSALALGIVLWQIRKRR